MQRVRDPLTGLHFDGAKARKLRLLARRCQTDVAIAAGISDAWLRQIELHDKQPSRSIAEDLAEALGVPLDDLVTRRRPRSRRRDTATDTAA